MTAAGDRARTPVDRRTGVRGSPSLSTPTSRALEPVVSHAHRRRATSATGCPEIRRDAPTLLALRPVATAVLALVVYPDPRLRRAMAVTLPLLTHGAESTGEMVAVTIALTLDAEKGRANFGRFALAEQW